MFDNWESLQELLDKDFLCIEDKLSDNLKKICTTRLHPDLLSSVKVLYYGEETPIKTVANIQLPTARSFLIKPFDQSCLDEIDKAIRKYRPDFNPIVTNGVLTINVPAPTEESRKKSVKDAKAILENSKISLRQTRKIIMQKIKDSKLSEDLEKSFSNNLDEQIKKETIRLDEIYKKKELELLTV